MANDLTKLITVSLGKIHQSRQDKHGVNLRRSLLVASVLHRARDQYVTDIKTKKVEDSDSSRPVRKASPRKRRFMSQKSHCDSETSSDETLKVQKLDNLLEASSELSHSMVSDFVLDQLCSGTESKDDKENTEPQSKSRVQCIKRKFVPESSSADTISSSDCKRTKHVESSTDIVNLAQQLSDSFMELSPQIDCSNNTILKSCSEVNCFTLQHKDSQSSIAVEA